MSSRAPGYQGRLTARRFWSRVAAVARLAAVKGAKFANDTAEKRRRRMARAVVRPEFFNGTYLPHYFPLPLAPFHRAMYRALETERLVVVEVPRGHGKSTSVTFAYSLRQVVCAPVLQDWCDGSLWDRDPLLAEAIEAELEALHREVRAEARQQAEREGLDYTEPAAPELVYDPYIQIGAVTLDLAVEFTTSIKMEMERNAALIYDWGELVSDPGVNYGEFVAGVGEHFGAKRIGVKVLAFGMTGGVVGSKHHQHRPTLAILDDPDKETLTLSSRKLRDQQQATLGQIRYGLDPQHRILVVGTRRHWDCLTARLINKPEFHRWTRIRFQAIQDDGTPLWVERWTLAMLLEIRAEDVEAFEREMMNNPPGDGVRLWSSWRHYTRGGGLCQAATQAIVILDPSLGRNEKSDWQAIVVLRFADEGPVLQEAEELVRLPPRELMRLLLDTAEEHDAVEILIEAIGFQELLVVLAEEDPRFVKSLPPIVQIQGQAQSKHVRISTLATASKRGQYLTPDDRSCHRTERQGLDYGERGNKVDALDAAEMGLRRVRQLRRGAGQRRTRTGGRRRDMREQPTGARRGGTLPPTPPPAVDVTSSEAPAAPPGGRRQRRGGGNRRRGGGRRGGGF